MIDVGQIERRTQPIDRAPAATRLQQFGRGLRKAPGKERLTVIDYIGNHRVFFLKPQTLFGLPSGDREIFNLLERLRTGTQELPPGCEVTYELEAVEILKSLLKRAAGTTKRAWSSWRPDEILESLRRLVPGGCVSDRSAQILPPCTSRDVAASPLSVRQFGDECTDRQVFLRHVFCLATGTNRRW